MCEVLGVSRSSYYAHLRRPKSKRAIENEDLGVQITQIHQRSRGRYGSPKITEELRRQGYAVSRPRVARLMQKANLRAKVSKKYRVTTNSKHDFEVAAGADQQLRVPHVPQLFSLPDL